ncbi:hypothetical protein BDF20DRAFT_914870 [Mycotypha africana]|uniref:uncharacterized protein n=1 Tax=Mycotypha africana TaxID=64632 RepID=UPI00230175AF|nr:uncharacterized protein BDF20DRAFT_914870 [Mycotypha africana]KAI8973423.1 hypothetical protein BDF20DRAFT_914870 [Mycotypha africana]
MDSSTKITPEEAPTHDLHGEPLQITEDGKIDLMAYTADVLSVMVHDVVLPSKLRRLLMLSALKVKIFDGDQIDSHKLLAEGTIPIATLESFATKEVDVQVNGAVLKLRLKWESQLLIRKYAGTSLLSTTTGLAFDVVGFRVGAGGKVLTGGSRLIGGSLGAMIVDLVNWVPIVGNHPSLVR